ncbi:uncharacterized protein LAJ45_09937 [Morchella importuna]|uniref:Cutinase n=1 Tax=Morchella conica CCBAS932 TaxID=1392247 RepID=A0A3N4L8J1_9PEZI|nr:uncharacterized protein LAJ45_09937 [Morchella importuna]KAH8146015.1 hypothetical protein LAJ45_09937 [Morchella importuna]RPB17802.1 cutinase [Morchella conica CCBAS932]
MVSSLVFLLALTSFVGASPIAPRQSLSTTRNDIVDGACKEVTVIFARGTTEAGNVGSLAGPPFFNALVADLSNAEVAVQGVDYPADVIGFLAGGSSAGASTMAGHVKTIKSSCPTTKIVLSGYSQGAQVTHKAAALLSTAEAAMVSSIVLFGDPNEGDAFPGTLNNHVKTFCNVGDLICLGQAIILTPHLTYSLNAGEAAEFVVSNL